LVVALIASGIPARRLTRVPPTAILRSEEHTSELQSLRHLVCRLLLEKKKKKKIRHKTKKIHKKKKKKYHIVIKHEKQKITESRSRLIDSTGRYIETKTDQACLPAHST